MVLAVTADDLVISETAAFDIGSSLREKRRYGRFVTYGKNPLHIPDQDSVENWPVDVAIPYLRKLSSHQEYIRENIVDIIQPFFVDGLATIESRNASVTVRHAGIQSVWHMNDFNNWVALRGSWFEEQFPQHGSINSLLGSSFYPHEGYQRPNPTDSLLINAYNKAWYANFLNVSRMTYGLSTRPHLARSDIFYDGINFGSAITAVATSVLVDKCRPSLSDVNLYRQELIDLQAREARDEHRDVSAESFRNYWARMKHNVSVHAETNEVRASFATVPLRPEGTTTSRTWGIEIETVQAQHCTRPPGWDKRGDGSLESMSDMGDCNYDYCNCDCDSCCDGEHDDCYTSEEDSDCAEFVSPVLSHFNSAGLRSLTEAIGDRPCNDSPGIHVHVGAGDLQPADISRLTRIYSIVSPFLWELTYRNVTGYCKDITPDNIAHWLASTRKNAQAVLALGTGATASQRIEISLAQGLTYAQNIVRNQPDDRYHDLNLHSLNAHGTVEFRAMGPKYDYKHLVRWAWLCRELVNLSKLAIPDSKWIACTSMADVLNIVYEYGSEVSDTVMSPLMDAANMDLSVEQSEEND